MKSCISTVIIFLFILVSSSCKVTKPGATAPGESTSGKPSIVFLSCSLAYDSISREYNLTLIDKIIVEGRLKDATVNSEKYGKDDFKYCLLNKNNQVISCTHFPNPLDKTIEYVSENGLLEKKEIRLDSTQFSLRISLTPDTENVLFENDNKKLLLINLNSK